MAEHGKNARRSTADKHEKGQRKQAAANKRPVRPGSKVDVKRRHDLNEGRTPRRPK